MSILKILNKDAKNSEIQKLQKPQTRGIYKDEMEI